MTAPKNRAEFDQRAQRIMAEHEADQLSQFPIFGKERTADGGSEYPNILGLDASRLYRDPNSCIGWAYDAAPRA